MVQVISFDDSANQNIWKNCCISIKSKFIKALGHLGDNTQKLIHIAGDLFIARHYITLVKQSVDRRIVYEEIIEIGLCLYYYSYLIEFMSFQLRLCQLEILAIKRI